MINKEFSFWFYNDYGLLLTFIKQNIKENY